MKFDTWPQRILLILGIGFLYFLSARLGLILAYEHTNASPVWPPSGLAFALVLIFGKRVWPGIYMGAFAANVVVFTANHAAGGSTIILTSACIALGNTLEALTGAYLVDKIIKQRNFLERYQDILWFVAIDIMMCVVSCTIGTTSLCTSGIVPWAIYSTVWSTWLAGDASGILVITPLILVWSNRRSFKWRFNALLEQALITIIIIFFSQAIFLQKYSLNDITTRVYVLVPFLLWMVFRFGHKEIISLLSIISAFAIWGTVHGAGPFVSPSLNDSLLQLIAFISIITITFMALSASLVESKRTLMVLQLHQEELEIKVAQRTKDIEETNQRLLTEIRDRQNAEIAMSNKTMQLAEAQKQAHIGSWEWDAAKDSISWSDELYNIYGLNADEFEPTYTSFLNFLHPEDKKYVNSIMKLALTERRSFNFFYKIIRYDGKIRILNTVGTVFTGENNHIIKIAGTAQDITELKQTEQKLLELTNSLREEVEQHKVTEEVLKQEMAERIIIQEKEHLLVEALKKSNKELNSYAYIVSHDLKAPLRGISTIATWLAEDYKDKLDANGTESIKLLLNRTVRMDNLINGILDYSKVGRVKEEIKAIDLNILVPELITTMDVPLHISISIEKKLPTVHFDQIMISQVFQNLISNAIKYNDKPSGKIKVDFTIEDNFYRFSVSDNGPGIEEKYFDKIFEIFQTLSARDEKESTGVGLSIIKKIVENNDGQIWLESELGEGSTFYFTVKKN